MGTLADWAKKNSKFIALEDGETIEAIFEGFKITTDSMNPDKEKIMYQLRVEQDGIKVVKTWETASGKVARFFDSMSKGSLVRITRHGIRQDTKYDLEEVGSQRKEMAEEETSPGDAEGLQSPF